MMMVRDGTSNSKCFVSTLVITKGITMKIINQNCSNSETKSVIFITHCKIMHPKNGNIFISHLASKYAERIYFHHFMIVNPNIMWFDAEK